MRPGLFIWKGLDPELQQQEQQQTTTTSFIIFKNRISLQRS